MARSLILLLLIALCCTAAASPREPLVVSTEWLAKHLDDPNLVLLHVGARDDYAAAHIRGARLISLQDLHISHHETNGLMLEMPAAADLEKRLESFGISDDSRIVVYYGKDWVSPATRIVFTLDYAGLGDRTSLLDGGIGAWTRAGHPTVTGVPEPRAGRLAPLKLRPIVVDAPFVRASIGKPGIALVDGRAAVFYDGIDSGESHGTEHRAGHIPSAGNVPFTSIVDDRMQLLPPAELRALLAKGGVKPGDTVLGYCHLGMQATAVLFAARTLGHKVLLYDGSFEDWSSRAGYPVANPSEKGAR